jgi:hypothetical protein
MELWQLDVMGSVLLDDGTELKAATAIDDHSQFCLAPLFDFDVIVPSVMLRGARVGLRQRTGVSWPSGGTAVRRGWPGRRRLRPVGEG